VKKIGLEFTDFLDNRGPEHVESPSRGQFLVAWRSMREAKSRQVGCRDDDEGACPLTELANGRRHWDKQS
jgi:hypothetical protein